LKHLILYLLTCLLLPFDVLAQQGVRGVVRDHKGDPVGFVTIYCKAEKKGTNSNADGSFELALPAGQHEIMFQCVGYKSVAVVSTVDKGYTPVVVTMQDQSYELRSVDVSANGVNPAVWIMRKAIAAAPYYKRQILSYNAKVYIKGSGSLDEIPLLLRKTLAKEGITEGMKLLMESINEVSFTQPNTYKEKALSVKSSLPVEGAPEPMSMLRGSMYNANTEGVVSPLSPQAFSVYTFTLEGSFYEEGKEVNRIKVTPKRKGNDVWEGYVYIMEGLWCLHSTDLRNKSQFDVRIITSFRPVPGYDFVWMPVTYDIRARGGMLGFSGSFSYLASVSNYAIRLNPNLDHEWVKRQQKDQAQVIPEVAADDQKTPAAAKPKTQRQEKIEALLAKDQLTKMEMVKLASNMKKEAEEDRERGNNLEIIDEDSSIMVVDSMATKRDSMFWQENRPVPLMETEMQSYVRADSLAAVAQKDTAVRKKSTGSGSGFDIMEIFLGTTVKLNKGKHFVGWSGIIGPGSEIFLNTVDGWGMAVEWQLGNKREDSKEWLFSNKIRVPFGRSAVNSYGRFEYRYKPLRKGSFALEGGSYISDFNSQGGPSQFVNSLMLIFDKRNLTKLFQQEYAAVSHETELANGLLWKADAGWYNRYELFNNRKYAAKESLDGKITPNTPIPYYYMPSHQATLLHTSFTYTPRQRYRIDKGKKIYVQGKLPTFAVDYTQGLPGILGSDVDYSKAGFSIIERIKPVHWLHLNAKLSHGFFLHNTASFFPDYAHFTGNRSPVLNTDPLYTFRQLDYYAYSTTRQYTTLHAELDFKRILVKRLPYINMTSIREVIFYNGLLPENGRTYQEVGYGVDRILGLLRADVFVGLKGNAYNNWGVRLVINTSMLSINRR
jgi:hypothetical protein